MRVGSASVGAEGLARRGPMFSTLGSRAALALSLFSFGCYQSHGLPSTDGGLPSRDAPSADGGPPVRRDAGPMRDAGVCDLSAVTCAALPGCLGERPPETLYCDDISICLASDPGDVMANAIAAVADRIQCVRADACDFRCFVADGGFDDEVRSEICAITRVAPSARIGCSIFGP